MISCDLDEAFRKITEKFDQTPSIKIFIPGQAPIEVPITNQTGSTVYFETSVVLNLNPETEKALKSLIPVITCDLGVRIQVKTKDNILSKTDLALHRIENEIERITTHVSDKQQLLVFCQNTKAEL